MPPYAVAPTSRRSWNAQRLHRTLSIPWAKLYPYNKTPSNEKPSNSKSSGRKGRRWNANLTLHLTYSAARPQERIMHTFKDAPPPLRKRCEMTAHNIPGGKAKDLHLATSTTGADIWLWTGFNLINNFFYISHLASDSFWGSVKIYCSKTHCDNIKKSFTQQ